MQKPSELDLAQLRHEFRELYKHLGFEGSCQVLYEFLVSAQALSEVIIDEQKKED